MLLGFKRRFEPMVKDGSKRHSIRGGERWRSGMICDCYVDPRQRTMRLLGRWTCSKVQGIRIEAKYESEFSRHRRKTQYLPVSVRIWIDGEELGKDEVASLCWADGFRSRTPEEAWYEFAEFWVKEHRKDLGDDLTLRFNRGQLIHWDYDHPPKSTAKRARAASC